MAEEVEALYMYLNKTQGILPNQYHHFYENGDTLIYPEHVADLLKVQEMFFNRDKNEAFKAEGKQAAKGMKNNKGGGKGSSNFFGRTFRYK